MQTAYAVGEPILVGQTEVIPGTRGVRDVLSWPGVVFGPYGSLWDKAQAVYRKYAPTSFVGHSLGADYALRMSDGRRYRGYGRPGLSVRPGDVMNLGDPFTWLARGKKRLAWGHGISSYQ